MVDKGNVTASGFRARHFALPYRLSDVYRTGKSRSRSFVRIATHAASPDGRNVLDDAILNVENAVASREILRAVCEAVVGRKVHLTSEHRSTTRTRCNVSTVHITRISVPSGVIVRTTGNVTKMGCLSKSETGRPAHASRSS
jgi:hypothetical protein